MVRSCTGWKRLSVNCSSRHDFPTPDEAEQTHYIPRLLNTVHRKGHEHNRSTGSLN